MVGVFVLVVVVIAMVLGILGVFLEIPGGGPGGPTNMIKLIVSLLPSCRVDTDAVLLLFA